MNESEYKISRRHWVAWKLVQLAAKIYDAEYYQRLRVYTPDGQLIVEWHVTADEWGAGVSSQYSDAPEGYRIECDDYDTFEYDDNGAEPTLRWND